MKINQQKGQALVESMISMGAQMIAGCLLFFVTSYAALCVIVSADAHSLARSSLYGTPRECRPAWQIPKSSWLKIHYRCPQTANVKYQITFSFLNYKLSKQSLVNLRR